MERPPTQLSSGSLEELQCPIGTLRRLMAKRKFPYLKLGGRVRVEASELESFLEKSRRVTATEAATPRAYKVEA